MQIIKRTAGLGQVTAVTVLSSTFSVFASTGLQETARIDAIPVASIQVAAFAPALINSSFTFPDQMIQGDSLAGSSDMITRLIGTKDLGAMPDFQLVLPELGAGFQEASYRLSSLANVSDGWKGPGSRAPSVEALHDGLSFLRKLSALSGNPPTPGVGLDEDGVYTLSWSDSGRSGCVSIYGDGTYSFFFRRGTQPFASDSESIGSPLNSDLVLLLTT